MTVSIERGALTRLRAAGPRSLAARAALATRRVLLAAADAVVPPHLVVFEQALGIARTELLQVAARLRLADRLARGPLRITELARGVGADAPTLSRALRALASGGVFRFRSDGRIENTRLSAALRTGVPASMRQFAEYTGSRANVEAWADLTATIRTGESAFARVHGTTVWEWFTEHPADGRTFSAALAQLAELDARGIADAWPFRRLRRVCDVAGGEGTVLGEILARRPGLRGVLLDRPDVVRRARRRLAERGVGERVTCVAGDFFQEVPGGCDGLLLKDVLHDWDDAAAVRILRACRRSAPPGALLLVVEMLIEPGEARSPTAFVDVQMLIATQGGRQRSRGEMETLLDCAGWTPREVLAMPGLPSMVVAARRPRTNGKGNRRRAGVRARAREPWGSLGPLLQWPQWLSRNRRPRGS